jgi:hypothetical protein
MFPVELNIAFGGRFGTSKVSGSPSASVASKRNTNVSPKVTLITVMFWVKTGMLFSRKELN